MPIGRAGTPYLYHVDRYPCEYGLTERNRDTLNTLVAFPMSRD